MAEIEIRRADDTDSEAIAAVLAAAFAAYRSDYTPSAYDATVLDAAQVRARRADVRTWVAVRDTEVVGTVTGVPRAGEVYVRSLAVLPATRGEGIGECLIAAVVEWAGELGAERVTLTTTPFLTASRQLYQRCGFVDDEGYDGGDLFGTPLIALVLHLRNTGSP